MSAETASQTPVACPTAKQLHDWLLGLELPDSVVLHIRGCARCKHSLASLTDDERLQALAANANASAAQYSDEPEFTALLGNLRNWSFNDASSLGDEANTRAETDRETEADAKQPEHLALRTLAQRLPAGRYLLDRLIATGGAAAVYLAYDQHLNREVAIKVLANDSLRDRQRFQREARLLAELDHPNIVRVLDFGILASEVATDDIASFAQCYLVMEYLAGGTAAQIGIDQPAWSNDEFGFNRMAELLATAADGLAAAHAHGFVHRDVKPGNLLLDRNRSTIKVADFGIARLMDTDRTQFTRTGELLGTPVFMSPEQVTANAVVTSASDIYSLGATMYQLLTGVAPYQGGPAAVLRQIVDSSPVSPRLIAPKIPEDLETICVRAMQPESSARYVSMQQLADDLRRFARGEPIVAKPISTTTKVLRFLRKNKSFAAVLAVCFGLAFILTSLSAAAVVVFRYQNEQLQQAAQNERDAKQAAESALKASITAADDLLLAVTTETEFLPRAPGSQMVTQKLLERARDYFKNFLETNQGNATLNYQLARAHAGLASVALRVGDRESLERETEDALALIEQIPESELSQVQRAALQCDTVMVLANYLTDAGEAKRSLPMLEQVTATMKAALEQSMVDVDDATLRDFQDSYATALFGLANAMNWVGKREECLPILKEARARFADLRIEHPTHSAYLRTAAACDTTLATIALDLDRPAEGRQHLLDALDLLDQIDEEDVTSLRIREIKIKVLTNLALAERKMGDNKNAKTRFDAVIEEAERLIELEPGVPSHSWNLVVAALNSGGPEMELGNFEPLIERWQATVPVLDKLIAGDLSNTRYRQVKAMLQSNIAIVLRDIGKLEEAIAPLEAATVTLREQAEKLDYAPESYLPVAVNEYELATTFIELKRYDKALAALDASDAVVATILEQDKKFTPALGHLLDSIHSRMQVQLKMQTKSSQEDIDALQQLADRGVTLARELASANTDVAEYQVEVPRALNDSAQLLLAHEQAAKALLLIEDSNRLLDTIEQTLDKDQPQPPDFRKCRKVAYLVEATAMFKLNESTSDKARLLELIEQARNFGATDDELKDFIDALEARQ